jgi:hypothetical protein
MDSNTAITLASSTETALNPVPFFRLAPELRIQIYKYIFIPNERDRAGNVTHLDNIIHIVPQFRRDVCPISSNVVSVSILRTNRLINAEALPVLYDQVFLLAAHRPGSVTFMEGIGRNVQHLKHLQMTIGGNEIFLKARVEIIKATLGQLPAVEELRLTNMSSNWAELIDWDVFVEMAKERVELRILVNHADKQETLAKTGCWMLLKETGQKGRAKSFDPSSEFAELCPHKGLRHWHDGSKVYFASR